MAKLNQPIQIQKFELIRNRIADILIDEITNQITLQYSDLFIIGVFIERFPTFDKTELPVINVSLARGSYDNEDVIQSDGTYTYYVDAFMRFSSVQNQDGSITDGSSLAAIKVQRAIAFCRTVLKNQAYRTLGFAPPFLNNITVSEFNIANPDREDMEHTIMARITVTVVAPETSELASAKLLDGYDTQVLLGDSALGYVFSGTGSIIPPPPPGSVNLVVNGDFFKELSASPYLLAIQNSQGLAVGLLDPTNNLVIVPDSVAEINGIEVLTIPSGATSEIKVLQNGVEVGSLVGGDWVVPVCADGAVTITDSDGATLYVVNVASGGAETQAIGDSSVEVRNSLNAVVDSGVVKAQGSGVFSAPDANVTVNGDVSFGTIPSDGSENILVENTDGAPVGAFDGNSNSWVVADSTVNVRKSDATLIQAVTVAAEDTESVNVADSVAVLKDTAANVISSTNIKATESEDIIAPDGSLQNSDASETLTVRSGEVNKPIADINIEVNTVVEGAIPAIKDVKILITDGVNPVTPDDVSVVGDTVTVEVPSGGGTPSGVLFKKIVPRQGISYRTGDEGWRVQNNWYDILDPTNPKVIAELDYSSTAWFNVLASPLIVNGVSSTVRFVDVDGGQTFSTTGNKSRVVIDKLYGLMYTRANPGNATWDNAIDNALTHTETVDAIVYSDWYLASMQEFESVYHQQTGVSPQIDIGTSIQVLNSLGNIWSATTDPTGTTRAMWWELATRVLARLAKGTSISTLYVRKAHNLITAP